MKRIIYLAITACLFSCTTKQPSEQKIKAETAKANAIYQAYFDSMVENSPEFQTHLGIKTDYDKWDNISDEHHLEMLALKADFFELLRDSVDYNLLDDFAKLAYDNLEIMYNNLENDKKYRFYNYPVNQMFGMHTSVISTLKNAHRIDSLKDAHDYISRVKGIKPLFEQLVSNMTTNEEHGVILPEFLFPKVIGTCENLIEGITPDNAKSHLLYLDFKSKIDTLSFDSDDQKNLLANMESALIQEFKPAYLSLIMFLTEQQNRATKEEGVWKFPMGDEFYTYCLEDQNTMKITAQEVYDLGYTEVDRIHREIEEIMKEVEFEGGVGDFLSYMRETQDFFLETTEENKQLVLDTINAIVDNVWKSVDDFFNIRPKADMIIKAVEPYREKSAGYAFYQRPAIDGSRPGIYYINLYSLSSVPLYEMEALTYHEAIPGHHFNIAIAQELTDIPEFMKYQVNTAHTEGWGLYSEYLGKEMGGYQNPYADFGRLNMELFRAVRLVVDAGIHYKKWDRQKAIDYYYNNTAASMRRCSSMVDRHMVMPGQATAYKIGMIKLMAFREKAEFELGDLYDIKDFHDVLLKYGLLPIEIVERLVDDYIADKKAEV